MDIKEYREVLIAVVLCLILSACSTTTATRYTFKDGEEVATEKLVIQGKGEATFTDGGSIKGEPTVEMPVFPPISYEQ